MNFSFRGFFFALALLSGVVFLRGEATTSTPTSESETSSPTQGLATPSSPPSVAAPAAVVTPVLPELAPSTPAQPPHQRGSHPHFRHRSNDDDDDDHEAVGLGDVRVAPGEPAGAVVAIMGNALAEAPIHGAVVAVFGNSEAKENVSESVVAVLGDAQANKEVGDSVVAVLGNASVDGHVNDSVVAVLGDVRLGPGAVVDGDIVSIGGVLDRDPQSVVHGHTTMLPLFGHTHALGGGVAWLKKTVFNARLLAFGPSLIWAWVVALFFLGAYVLIGLAFSRGVTRCVETLEQRPGWTILAALLTAILAPVLLVLLTVTVFGALFLGLALFFGIIFGKAAFLAWLGRRFGELPGAIGTAASVLIGGIIVLFLFTVPVIGLLIWGISGFLGLGMVVYTLILSMRREKSLPPRSASPVGSAPTPAPHSPVVSFAPSVVSAAAVPPTAPASPAAGGEVSAAVPPASSPRAERPPMLPSATSGGADRIPVSAVTLPRVGFGLRLAASLLDLILICFLAQLLHLRGWFLPLYTFYCVAMWATKATTIGGIICGLKIVRLDDRRIDWSIALIRALGAFLSGAVFGLGFLWVVFDDETQSWHDKVAGTTIVRVPKGVSLI